MNFNDDGTVLPSFLLSHHDKGAMDGFNKTYRNTSLKVGVILNTYPVGKDGNRTGLATEYDVVCIEQNEDRGATTILYKNCVSMASLGGIADFVDRTLRARKSKNYTGDAVRLNQQDGSVVLVLCLDGSADKAIILGGFPHPDRKSTLVNDQPRLEGEYNGANVKVENDGSVTFTFRGATDNKGVPTDASQGPTVAKIEKDGSFEINHKTVTFRLDKKGVVTVKSDGDINVTTGGKANVKATGDATIDAGGKATVKSGGDTVINAGGDCNVTASGKAVVKASEIDLNGSAGMVLTTVTDPVVDTIFGAPTQGIPTVKGG